MHRFPWLIASSLLVSATLGAQSATPWVCHTKTNISNETFEGGCPTEGACDVPATRDAYLTTASTPIRWMRIHLVVFRDDALGLVGRKHRNTGLGHDLAQLPGAAIQHRIVPDDQKRSLCFRQPAAGGS